MARADMPDVIVLLPGILGSVLRKDGRDVWAASAGGVLAGLLSRGQSIRELTLIEDNLDEDLGDGVTADRLMPDVHILPRLWKIDGYSKIRQQIAVSFNVTQGENYFEFPYDWRRDNQVAAIRLQKISHDWLERWRSNSGSTDAKLILIAHSMGGLVARYFLEVLDGWRNTKALITFGTPYRGALGALDALTNGVKKGPFDFSEFARSLTSVYQLLPIYPCYDIGDGGLVRVGETSGIPNVVEQRAREALAFHREIMARADERVRQSDSEDNGHRIFPIVGTEQPTLQSARLAGVAVEFLEEYEGEDERGDGTVPRVSATPPELDEDPRDMYAATRHASLQNADAVLTHMGGVIMRLYLDLSRYRRLPRGIPLTPPAKLSLRIEDIYLPNEPIAVHVRPDTEGLDLEVTIANVDSGAVVAQGALGPPGDGGWRHAEFSPLAEGVYRISVGVEAVGVEPVSDVFAVIGELSD
jgi:pimeloyl-ACP methyl ester carboxylesterase